MTLCLGNFLGKAELKHLLMFKLICLNISSHLHKVNLRFSLWPSPFAPQCVCCVTSSQQSPLVTSAPFMTPLVMSHPVLLPLVMPPLFMSPLFISLLVMSSQFRPPLVESPPFTVLLASWPPEVSPVLVPGVSHAVVSPFAMHHLLSCHFCSHYISHVTSSHVMSGHLQLCCLLLWQLWLCHYQLSPLVMSPLVVSPCSCRLLSCHLWSCNPRSYHLQSCDLQLNPLWSCLCCSFDFQSCHFHLCQILFCQITSTFWTNHRHLLAESPPLLLPLVPDGSAPAVTPPLSSPAILSFPFALHYLRTCHLWSRYFNAGHLSHDCVTTSPITSGSVISSCSKWSLKARSCCITANVNTG